MEGACRKEIERLHEFFVQWFTATIPKEAFGEACLQAFSPNMSMIPPSGKALDHSQLIQGLLERYACHEGKQFSIEISGMNVILQQDELCIVTYEERQLLNGEETCRTSTATFRNRPDTPCGVEWVHLQETWMNTASEKPSAPAPAVEQAETTATAAVVRPHLSRATSLVSKRRHLSPKLQHYQTTTISKEGEVVGIELNGWRISSQQHAIGDDAWFTQATERLQELAQPASRPTIDHAESHSITYRHICLPEMVFPRAHITLEQANTNGMLKLKFGAYSALLEWAQAHQSIPLGSSEQYKGVSVLQVADAKLWACKDFPKEKEAKHSNFHYDWTFSTPHACTTTMDVSWTRLEESGMNMALLQDQTVPILLFDEVVLYEDDLHDNGVVTLTCKIRVMPTCVYCLQRLWVRVDQVLLRVRDTRVLLEFGDECKSKVFRDITWRECAWEDLSKHGLPTDLRSWCPETGSVTENVWQAQTMKIPVVELPSDLPAHAVLDDETCS